MSSRGAPVWWLDVSWIAAHEQPSVCGRRLTHIGRLLCCTRTPLAPFGVGAHFECRSLGHSECTRKIRGNRKSSRKSKSKSKKASSKWLRRENFRPRPFNKSPFCTTLRPPLQSRDDSTGTIGQWRTAVERRGKGASWPPIVQWACNYYCGPASSCASLRIKMWPPCPNFCLLFQLLHRPIGHSGALESQESCSVAAFGPRGENPLGQLSGGLSSGRHLQVALELGEEYEKFSLFVRAREIYKKKWRRNCGQFEFRAAGVSLLSYERKSCNWCSSLLAGRLLAALIWTFLKRVGQRGKEAKSQRGKAKRRKRTGRTSASLRPLCSSVCEVQSTMRSTVHSKVQTSAPKQ